MLTLSMKPDISIEISSQRILFAKIQRTHRYLCVIMVFLVKGIIVALTRNKDMFLEL